jgi:hypothetical protein
MIREMMDSREAFDEIEPLQRVLLVSWDSDGVNMTREVIERVFDAFIAELEFKGRTNITWEVVDFY